ncbi:MAG: pilus assembly protein [Anaerolineae bacterium]|nr:pilus assembly protein [Anaerolineae bacterium]
MKRVVVSITSRVRAFLGDESGQAIVWVAVMLPLFLSIIGLAIDGGIVFSERRELQNIADGAARAGAMQIDERVYRASSGERVVLDVEAAPQVAAAYVSSQPRRLTAEVAAEPSAVTVQVTRDVPTTFLQLAGVRSARVTAVAVAQARYGIERGNR